eukprot:444182-Amphidinium_carterae.1
MCSSEEVSEAHFFLSVALIRAGQPDGAIKALRKSVVWHPKHAWRLEWLSGDSVVWEMPMAILEMLSRSAITWK